jgi:hypothetical protein
MSGPREEYITCEAVREELPALLYDEAPNDRKRCLQAHLRACEPCRAELKAHRRTMNLLDQWTLEPGKGRATFPWTPRPRGKRFDGLRPVLIGTAAALIAFAALSMWGVSVSRLNGQWIVSLGHQQQDQMRAVDTLPHGQRRAVRSIVDDALDYRLQELLVALEADLAGVVHGEQRQRLLLASAVEEVRDADAQRFGAVIDALLRRQVEAERDVERFQAEMIAWKETLGQSLAPSTDEEHVKENS